MGVVVVGADPVAVATTEALRRRRVDVLRVGRDQLCDVDLSLAAESLRLARRPVDAVLLREPVGGLAAASFAEVDREFVNAEVSATWLAATQLDSVLTINCLDAEGWFDQGWSPWHRRLRAAGVELSPLSFGDRARASHWRSYLGGGARPVPAAASRRALGTALGHASLAGSALFACGEAMGDQPPAPVVRAADVLRRSGVQLKSIDYDSHGRVAAVNVFPLVVPELIEPVARRLACALHEHLRSR